MKLSKLISLGFVAPAVVIGSATVGSMNAQAAGIGAQLGSVDVNAFVRFAPAAPGSPAEFYFDTPAICFTTGCDFGVAASSGLLNYASAPGKALSPDYQYDLVERVYPYAPPAGTFPSLIFPDEPDLNGDGADGSCLVNAPLGPSNYPADVECSGKPISGGVTPIDQISETLIPVPPATQIKNFDVIPLLTLDDGMGNSYSAFLKEITKNTFFTEADDPTSANAGFFFDLKWIDNSTDEIYAGSGSIAVAFDPTAEQGAFGAELKLNIHAVPEPTSILGMILAGSAGLLSFRKKES